MSLLIILNCLLQLMTVSFSQLSQITGLETLVCFHLYQTTCIIDRYLEQRILRQSSLAVAPIITSLSLQSEGNRNLIYFTE